MTIRDLERRVEQLEGDTGGGDGMHITITSSRVNQNGEDCGPVAEIHAWEDENGEWHSEKTHFREDTHDNSRP